MTMLQMLAKVICSIKLFAHVALAKFMDVGKVLDAIFPIRRVVAEFFPAEAADIGRQIMRIGKG